MQRYAIFMMGDGSPSYTAVQERHEADHSFAVRCAREVISGQGQVILSAVVPDAAFKESIERAIDFLALERSTATDEELMEDADATPPVEDSTVEYDMGMYSEMRAAVAEHGGLADLLPDDEFECCVEICAKIANQYLKQELASQATRLQVTIDEMYDELEGYKLRDLEAHRLDG